MVLPMSIALQIDTHSARFVETARGTVEAKDLLRILELKRRHPDLSPTACTLSDFRNCQLRLSTDQIRDLARRSADHHIGPFAILVDTDLNYALARQFQAYRESCTGPGTVGVFRDLVQVEKWLRNRSRLANRTK